MAKLILFSILIAAWSVTYTGQSLSALLDETASAIQFYEMNENRPTKDIIYSEHKHEDKFDSLRPKVARLVAGNQNDPGFIPCKVHAVHYAENYAGQQKNT